MYGRMNDTVWCGNKTTNKFPMATRIEEGREWNIAAVASCAANLCVNKRLHPVQKIAWNAICYSGNSTVAFILYWNSCNLLAFCLQCDWRRNEGKNRSNALFPCTGHYIDYHVSMHSAWMQRKQNCYSLRSKGKECISRGKNQQH